MITCTFEGGEVGKLRHITGAIFIHNKEKNRILLAQRSGKYSEPYKWGPPGGYMDRDETVAEMVAREAFEETGWRVEVGELLRINDNPNRPKEDKQNVDFIFLGEAIVVAGEFDQQEIKTVSWFDLDKLPVESDMAFDHYENMQVCLAYLKTPFATPILGKVPADILNEY